MNNIFLAVAAGVSDEGLTNSEALTIIVIALVAIILIFRNKRSQMAKIHIFPGRDS